jgi:glutaminyl-tRNA synthetase
MEPEHKDDSARGLDFIRQIVTEEVAAAKNGGRVQTRFPPEPNGYLHIGHAMAICTDFGVAQDFSGSCFLRFDDTNPERENEEFVEGIKRDVRWLGFDWGPNLRHASDYFPRIYDFAVELVTKGLAYVDHSTAEEIRAERGTLTERGKNSKYRDRTVAENLKLLEGMRRGDFDEGECVLRAKIDMASPNINLRDPTLYRIRKVSHQQTPVALTQWPLPALPPAQKGGSKRLSAMATGAEWRGGSRGSGCALAVLRSVTPIGAVDTSSVRQSRL